MTKSVIEMAREADIAVAHMNKPMTDEEVRLAWCNEFAALVREDEREKKQWRDLTDDELNEVMETWATAWLNLDPDTKPNGEIYIARAVIAKFKEKQL